MRGFQRPLWMHVFTCSAIASIRANHTPPLPIMCSIRPIMASQREARPETKGCQTAIHRPPCRQSGVELGAKDLGRALRRGDRQQVAEVFERDILRPIVERHVGGQFDKLLPVR